jgi:hypothetical protein
MRINIKVEYTLSALEILENHGISSPKTRQSDCFSPVQCADTVQVRNKMKINEKLCGHGEKEG